MDKRRPKSRLRSGALRADAKSEEYGGWKVHLTIGPASYEEKVEAVKRWLHMNFEGNWKHLCGGDQHEKDFTIYLGSYATMMSFVHRLEKDPVVQRLKLSKAGPSDRIVGGTGKIGARFDPRGRRTRCGWLYGSNGIPISDKYMHMVLQRESRERAVRLSKELLLQKFGDYFLPKDIG